MKRFFRAAIAAGLALGGGPARGELRMEPASVDLGRRAQQQVVETKVVLINTGAAAVTILEVQADCSCTVGTPGKRALAPGERTELSIKSETRTYQGEISRRVVVRTSEGDVALPVKMTVAAHERWDVKPPFLTLAPSRRGKEAGGEMTLVHLGSEPVDVTSITAQPAWVSGTVSKREGKTFTVALAKKADAPVGNHLVKMTATTTDEVNPQVSFSVFMTVVSAVRVKPASLMMPVGKVGMESRLRAEILGWDGDLPPRLELTHGTATLLGLGEEGLAFEIAITPQKAGPLTQLVRIYAGDELVLEAPVIFRAE